MIIDDETTTKYLSVKEFAARAGVSTQRIYQLLAKNLQGYCKEINGSKFIDEMALSQFDVSVNEQGLAKETPENLQSTLQEQTIAFLKEQISSQQKQIDTLTEQLKKKDEQLTEKDKQIEQLTSTLLLSQQTQQDLTAALTTAQALHAGTIQKQLTFNEDKPAGFFKNFFRKNDRK